MHDWHALAVWLGVVFVVLPMLAGGVLGYALCRRAGWSGGRRLRAIIAGAVFGAAAGAALTTVWFGY